MPAAAQMPLRGAGPAGGDAMTSCLAGMASNTWQDASTCVGTNTTLRSVAWDCTAQPCASNGQPGVPSDAPTTAQLVGSSDVSGVMTDWGGGVYDSDDALLLVTGGGHLGYYGNEIYAFNLKTLQWQRMTVPSSLNGFTKGTSAETFPDGQPVGSHSYGNLAYVPGVGLFMTQTCGQDTGGCGNEAWFQTVSGMSAVQYNHWSALQANPCCGENGMAAFDATANRVYEWGNTSFIPPWYLPSPYGALTAWVSTVGNGTATNNGSGFYGTIQPGVQFATVGAGNGVGATGFAAASLTTGDNITFSFTGDSSIPSCGAPGFEWDSSSSEFVGWCGGKNVVLLNPSTYAFTLHTVGGTVTPLCTDVSHCTSSTGKLANGVFGRFRCLRPTYNACIVVNTVDDHVYIYKPDF